MPRRSPLSLDDIATLDTLATAFWRAARGAAHGEPAERFARHLDHSLAQLGEAIRSHAAPIGRWTRFFIHDPKRRQILAPCFPDRVLHHALMAHAGPVLERALVADTFACREGKGTLAAVQRAQHHARRFPWFVAADVQSYFASIDHDRLREVLARRFKNPGLLALIDRILARTPCPSGRGLPIGALTSQYFANSYLDALDRYLLETLRVSALVRYMDDIVWWCDSKAEARDTLRALRDFAWRSRRLIIKDTARSGQSEQGLPFLGFRVLPGALRLSPRRRRRYAAARARWEALYASGRINADALQAGYTAALATTAHADALGWRREQLRRRPPVDA
ncbi:MAG: RNA-directed DNA polymerase [Myxococcales bacterium]|nr:RNA-directed DNA polymerase [Myxococcales bacterium]